MTIKNRLITRKNEANLYLLGKKVPWNFQTTFFQFIYKLRGDIGFLSVNSFCAISQMHACFISTIRILKENILFQN